MGSGGDRMRADCARGNRPAGTFCEVWFLNADRRFDLDAVAHSGAPNARTRKFVPVSS